MNTAITSREYEEASSALHVRCETCKGQMCACRDKCPGDLMEATRETYPGRAKIDPAIRVCVECAPLWEGA